MSRRAPGRSGAYRRTAAALAATVAVTAGTLLAAPAGHAEELEATPPESGEIRNGTAKAIATVGLVGPGVGNLALAMTTGTAVTQVTNSLAQATSQAADLGLIGSSLTAETCRGTQNVEPEDLPQPLSVDNRDGDAQATAAEGGGDGGPALGHKAAAATDEPPAARARTTGVRMELPGIGEIGGGEAEASTRVLPGAGREAVATVRAAVRLAGAVELSGMRWRAHHRTGTDPLAEGAFTVEEAVVGGAPVPTGDTAALEDAVNAALEPLGLTVRFPTVERVTAPNDFVRVTPLLVELRDSPAGKAVLGPVLDATRDQRGQAFDDLVAVACDLASLLLVGDVAVSVVGGTGFLTLGIGGVEASSGDLAVGNPFGVAPPLAPTAAPLAGGAPGVAPTPGAPVPGTPGAVPGAAPTPATRPARATGPVEEVCESLHPNGTRCSEGAAVVVGLLGLLATVGVAGADVVRQRRLDPTGEA